MSSDADAQPEVKLSEATMERLRAEMRQAVAAGLTDALDDKMAIKFWLAGLHVLQENATAQTGRFILDGAWYALRRAFWVGLAFLALYMVGGWSVVKSLWIAATASRGGG